MHHDWRLFDACRTGDENELLGLLQDGVNPNLRGTNSKIMMLTTLTSIIFLNASLIENFEILSS